MRLLTTFGIFFFYFPCLWYLIQNNNDNNNKNAHISISETWKKVCFLRQIFRECRLFIIGKRLKCIFSTADLWSLSGTEKFSFHLSSIIHSRYAKSVSKKTYFLLRLTPIDLRNYIDPTRKSSPYTKYTYLFVSLFAFICLKRSKVPFPYPHKRRERNRGRWRQRDRLTKRDEKIHLFVVISMIYRCIFYLCLCCCCCCSFKFICKIYTFFPPCLSFSFSRITSSRAKKSSSSSNVNVNNKNSSGYK